MSIETKDLLATFCAAEDGRYQLSRPWVRGGWRYAADAFICVRAPAPNESESEGIYPPSAEALGWSDEAVGPWPPLVAADVCDHEPDPCECGGCDRCEGIGVIECPECGQDAECPKCRGKGGDCPKCRGKGYVLVSVPLARVAGQLIKERFWRKIAALPGVQLARSAAPPEKKDPPIPFVFDGGGQGLVMPVRFEDLNEP